jgi:hypothetical protein
VSASTVPAATEVVASLHPGHVLGSGVVTGGAYVALAVARLIALKVLEWAYTAPG